MALNFLIQNGIPVAELMQGSPVIENTQDFLDIMADAAHNGAVGIIVDENQLPAGFFELKTGIAGDILQKFSNYKMYLAIIGNFSKYKSKSLQDFIRESNRGGKIIFAGSKDEAGRKFS